MMTVLGGEIVHASDDFSTLNPPLPPVSPDWSPIKYYGTYGHSKTIVSESSHQFICPNHSEHQHKFNFHLGCYCWAF